MMKLVARGWFVFGSAVLLLGCRGGDDGDLRGAYERMMASAERRAADTARAAPAEVPAAPIEPGPASLPIDTLPAAPAAAPETAAAPPARDTFPMAFEGTAGVEQSRRPGMPPTVLRDVRAAPHDGFDRIVFEFSGAAPGYRVEHVDRPIRECGSGRSVEIAGQGWLRVRLEPAQAHELVGETARVTVSNRNRSLGFPVVRQATLTCDFEGQVEWVLGLAAPNRFRVLELAEPARLVVDVLQ